MAEEPKGSERRQFKRYSVNLTVSYREREPLDVRVKTADRETQATMVDIGEGGMCILTDLNVAVATVLFIRFALMETEQEGTRYYGTVEVNGKVCYNIAAGNGMYRLGIAFSNLDEIDRFEIRHFLEIIEKHERAA